MFDFNHLKYYILYIVKIHKISLPNHFAFQSYFYTTITISECHK